MALGCDVTADDALPAKPASAASMRSCSAGDGYVRDAPAAAAAAEDDLLPAVDEKEAGRGADRDANSASVAVTIDTKRSASGWPPDVLPRRLAGSAASAAGL